MWLAELLIVAVGVLLALWAQEFVNGRRRKALEREYLISLKEDLESDLQAIHGQRERLSVFTAAVEHVLDVVDGRRLGTDDPAAFVRAATSCFYVEFFQPSTTTLEELKTTGHLRVLTRRSLVRAVLIYHQRVEASYRTRPVLMDRLWNGLWAAVKEHIDRRVFERAMDAVYASTAPRLDAPHGEASVFTRAVSVPSDAAPFDIRTIRDNESLRAHLLDALEVHAALRGELGVYEQLCNEALGHFAHL